MHVDDLVMYLRLAYSRRFFDLFESQITAQVRLIESHKDISGFDRKMWSEEARQSLRFALFLRYYAAFENQLRIICDRFAENESLPLRLSDVSGDNFLKRVNKYLTKVVGCDAIDKHPLWIDVLSYSWIRNTIIHNDGKVLDMTSIPQHVLRQTKPTAGLKITPGGNVKFGRRFCYSAVRRMARFLLDIHGRKQ